MSTSRSPGTPTTSSSHLFVPGRERLHDEVLQRVGAGERAAKVELVEVIDECRNRRRVRCVEDLHRRMVGRIDGRRHGDLDCFGIRGVVAVFTLHEGVFARRG